MTDRHKTELLRPGDDWWYELFTVDEVARTLKVMKPTVYRWCSEEKLGHFQLPSGAIRFAGLHVRRFLDEGGTSDLEAEHVLLAASPPIDEDE